ncbi:MAG: 2-oxoacid:acceptor oxidoreductase family protein [Planctomycetes bacterium]|nr:2-oxoacid:acceptor oxidoreductase family protein [Planctomycetota bacterium]
MIRSDAGGQAMSEIRLVGRGGQGVVTAGDLLGKAALREGRWAQSIPTFGPERRGALCMSTLRFSDAEILIRCSSSSPDIVLILDPTIWRLANVLSGLKEDGAIILNISSSPAVVLDELRSGALGYAYEPGRRSLHTVDATRIAREVLGKPITNTAMIGAFAGVTGLVEMEAIEAVFAERFGDMAGRNVEAARAARAQVQGLEG